MTDRLKRLGAVRSALLMMAAVTLLCAFEPMSSALKFERILVEQGQVWRLATAWVAQLNWQHWLINQWGLVVLALLLPTQMSAPRVAGFVFVWLMSSVLLWFSDYTNYTGLSGLLYGWLVLGLVYSPFYPAWLRWLIGVVITAKVLQENALLPVNDVTGDWVAALINANVAHESHLWGLVSGLIYLLGWYGLQRLRLMRARRS